jgi:hypothetical protein
MFLPALARAISGLPDITTEGTGCPEPGNFADAVTLMAVTGTEGIFGETSGLIGTGILTEGAMIGAGDLNGAATNMDLATMTDGVRSLELK